MGRSSIGSLGTDFTSQHWLSLDPCGLICLTFSYCLHLFALFASGFTLIAHHLLAQLLYGEIFFALSAKESPTLFNTILLLYQYIILIVLHNSIRLLIHRFTLRSILSPRIMVTLHGQYYRSRCSTNGRPTFASQSLRRIRFHTNRT